MDLKNGKAIPQAVRDNVSSSHQKPADLKDLESFSAERIKSTGYVVDTLEASLWCLLKTSSFREALEAAVNLGGDTDTIGAVTGSTMPVVVAPLPESSLLL
ncbi:MAG: ADP-ribosylglycohydrolase family protein [Treponema sp.]|nr:ADP-ribosylglycohydrolase family protein [Treponema sp.]